MGWRRQIELRALLALSISLQLWDIFSRDFPSNCIVDMNPRKLSSLAISDDYYRDQAVQPGQVTEVTLVDAMEI